MTQYNEYGDIFTLDEFVDMVQMGFLIPNDGTLGEVFVDEDLTNLYVVDWGGLFSKGRVPIPLPNLITMGKTHKIEVVWYNK